MPCLLLRQILPQRIRFGLSKDFFEKRRREYEEAHRVPVIVPEQYRMFAEHRVVIERDNTPTRRRQGRTQAPPSLVPGIIKDLKNLKNVSLKNFGRKRAADADDAGDGDGEDDDGDEADGDAANGDDKSTSSSSDGE